MASIYLSAFYPLIGRWLDIEVNREKERVRMKINGVRGEERKEGEEWGRKRDNLSMDPLKRAKFEIFVLVVGS